MARASAGLLATAWAFCTSAAFRHARAAALQLRLVHKASLRQLFAELSQAAGQLARWKLLAGESTASAAPRAYQVERQTIEVWLRDVTLLAPILPEQNLEQLPIDAFGTLLAALFADTQTPHRIPKLRQIEKGLADSGVEELISEIRATKTPSKTWPAMFEYALLASALDAASQQDPEVRGFIGATHSRYVSEFSRLDEERIEMAADRVRRVHGERAVAAMNANPGQEHLIRAEAAKFRRHLPLRKVFAQAADVLTAVCPCWMASPLSVSQLLDGGRQYFDFVIFDEASQVLPEDAVPSILRGKRVVVAGDNQQLPPTTFFAASDEEEYVADEETGASEGFESLLDMMIPFVRQFYLDWHYRSRDETLINFSNHHIYKDRLVTFPGAGGPPAIGHVLIKQETGVDGQEESSTAEVRKVVELVLQHARTNPSQTLGVITMGIRHMYRVQAALDRQLENHPDLEAFFDPSCLERFFIKNLERVQGDERDAIIISIGYGKDRAGNLLFRFGPLLSVGGRRRLNVAVTRARQRITLVSSFSHLDMDLARVRPGSGVELLRDYLQYAGSNGKRLGDAQVTGVPLNDFEQDIFDTLTQQGLRLIGQLGASRFRIDMVAQHPTKPGRFVLAIECDGASYHSSYTARDRDRLRQQQLENLGWRFHRIWSTDWFMRKDEEVKRAVKAFHEAVEFADKIDRGVVVAEDNRTNAKIRNEAEPSNTPSNRGPRPAAQVRTAISEYSKFELIQLIEWISSDGQLRTDDEIVSEMIRVLGLSRRGVRIEAAIRSAITMWRSSALQRGT